MKNLFSHKFFSLFILSLALALGFGQLNAQQPNIIYIYDDLGRLSRIVDQNNECATYEYDTVGNLLSITRSTNCLQFPTITSLSPDSGNVGETVCVAITGTNFLGGTVTTDNPQIQISRTRVSDTSIDTCLNISPFSPLGPTRVVVNTPAGSADRLFTVNPRIVVLTQNTFIGPTDQRFDGAALTIEGPATVTMDGTHQFASLALRNGALLTHSLATATTTSKLDLKIDGSLTIDASSRIDVRGRGFLGGQKPGNPFGKDGMTVGFQRGSRGGSGSGTGGGYGGLGGAPSDGIPNPVYGEFRDPNDPGSGGSVPGAFGGTAGNGGGLVRIVAQTIQLDGIIRVDGETSTTCCVAGGSGGGIRIDVGTLQGAGQVTAVGGNGAGTATNGGGGGGGGRLAVYYQNITAFDLTRMTAFGGTGIGAPNGGAGTIYLQGPGREQGELFVDNNSLLASSLSTPLIPGTLGDLRIRRGGRGRIDASASLTGTLEISSSSELTLSDKRLDASAMQVLANSLVNHLPTTPTARFKVDLNVNTLTIDATSRIDVRGRGFLGGQKPGNPFGKDGMTVGFQRGSRGGSGSATGGGYGGLGGAPSDGIPNPVYGDFRDPNDPGSGGSVPGAFGGFGGNGGGLIRIVAESLQLDGTITADGETPSGCCIAGGSGGGIRIDVGTLQGAGQITTGGGNGSGTSTNGGGGGGGGGVAIYYQNITGFDLARMAAFGGTGVAAPNGGAGTIYLQGAGRETGELIADNNNLTAATQSTPILSTASKLVALTNLRVRQRASVRVDDQMSLTGTLEVSTSSQFIPVGRVIASAVNVTTNGVITQLPTTASAFFKVDLSATSMTIDATGRIDVSSRGFLGGQKPGNPFGKDGMTTGFARGSRGGGGSGTGGSYGGLGGAPSDGIPNPVYGASTDPNEPGSGGSVAGAFGGFGGNGGGLIRIVAETLQVDGTITANGETPSGCCIAGGSGGGIRIDVGTLQGTGQITAGGGNGSGTSTNGGGGGGGGRVAVYFQNATGFDLARVNALGGAGIAAPNGQNGTVFTKQQTFVSP